MPVLDFEKIIAQKEGWLFWIMLAVRINLLLIIVDIIQSNSIRVVFSSIATLIWLFGVLYELPPEFGFAAQNLGPGYKSDILKIVVLIYVLEFYKKSQIFKLT